MNSKSIVAILMIVLLAGCSSAGLQTPDISRDFTPSESAGSATPGMGIKPSPVMEAVPEITPGPTTEPSAVPSPSPSSTPMPSPTIVSAPERLDYTALDRADGTKLEWGVRSNGRDTPGITDAQRAVLDKYNAHFMGDPSRKKIHFLFSAGYEAGYTGLILDTLKKHDIKALFFLVGDYVELEPDLVRRMLDEGHEIGNHSFRHSTLPYADNAKLQYEILDYDKYFRSIYGRGFRYFMPPSGVYSEKVLEAARQMGYTTLFWSFAYWDFDIKNQQGADYAYNNIMGSIHNGEFLFLHTVSSANAHALDRVITDLKLMGYEIGLPEY